MPKLYCYVCGPKAKCRHGRPIARPSNGAKSIPSALMGDREDRKVVFQPNGTQYVAKYGSNYTPEPKSAARWPDGSLRIRSDGSGKMHNPKVESIEGDVLARYLELVPNPSPGALAGRDWKTGKISAYFGQLRRQHSRKLLAALAGVLQTLPQK